MGANANAGWYSDPTGRYANRYWDGAQWTNSVSAGGSNSTDALDAGERLAPPAPGTAAVALQTSPPQAIHVSTANPRSGGASVVGMILSVVAVIFLIAVLVAVITNSNDDSSPTPTTEAPAATEAPGEDE